MRCWHGYLCLERGANDLHMVQLMSLPPHCQTQVYCTQTYSQYVSVVHNFIPIRLCTVRFRIHSQTTCDDNTFLHMFGLYDCGKQRPFAIFLRFSVLGQTRFVMLITQTRYLACKAIDVISAICYQFMHSYII